MTAVTIRNLTTGVSISNATSVVTIALKGTQGAPGTNGDITPDAIAARDAAQQAQAAAEAASASAAQDAALAQALLDGTALLRHGTGAPDDALGNDGDYYIDDTGPKNDLWAQGRRGLACWRIAARGSW